MFGRVPFGLTEERLMRIAVVGTGGIGAAYGASLAAAGADVTFVARGAHLTAIRENGRRIEGDHGETHIRSAPATDDIAGIGAVDFVLICVILWDIEEVANACARSVLSRSAGTRATRSPAGY